MEQLAILVVYYLVGSVPVAWIVGKIAGVGDIREWGSGNAGVMNVALNASRLAGLVVFLAEIGKAIITVVSARRLNLEEWMLALAVLAAVLGTRHSIWIGGKGGRGNTLIVSSITLISWQSTLIGLLLWLVGRRVTGSSYRATRLWLLALPFTLGIVTRSWPYALMGGVLAATFLSTHQPATDDHTLIKESYPNLLRFLIAPRRPEHPLESEMRETQLESDEQNVCKETLDVASTNGSG
jgi:acyl phosphate:glycerol-3-phosphate acyltransferase